MEKTMMKPTEAEIEILEVLWENGSQTVRFVNEELEKKGKNVAYTTTLKMMQIMTEKGMLARILHGRTHIYTPLMEKDHARNMLVTRMINSAFGGSAAQMVLQALGNHRASAEELKEIKDLIEKLEEEQKKQ